MPHDCKGNELKAGDVVTLYARVREVFPSETACNVTVEAIDVADVGEYRPVVTCNTRLFVKASPPELSKMPPGTETPTLAPKYREVVRSLIRFIEDAADDGQFNDNRARRLVREANEAFRVGYDNDVLTDTESVVLLD